MRMPIIVKAPYNDGMLFQEVILVLKHFAVIQPVRVIPMVIKGGFVSNDKVGSKRCRFIDDVNRCKHRSHNTSHYLLSISGFYGVNGFAEGRTRNFRED
jgi:hypothetical protein